MPSSTSIQSKMGNRATGSIGRTSSQPNRIGGQLLTPSTSFTAHEIAVVKHSNGAEPVDIAELRRRLTDKHAQRQRLATPPPEDDIAEESELEEDVKDHEGDTDVEDESPGKGHRSSHKSSINGNATQRASIAVPIAVPIANSSKRKLSLTCAGESEAHALEDELRDLERREARLTKHLKRVQARLQDIRSMFIDTFAFDDNERDVPSEERPMTPSSDSGLLGESSKQGKHVRIAEPKAYREQVVMTVTEQSQSRSEPTGAPGLELPTRVVYEPSSYFVWLDLETNAAERNFQDLSILEIAVRITDRNFVPVDEGVQYLVHPRGLTYEALCSSMPAKVRDMHTKSGLLDEWAAVPPERQLSVSAAADRVCRYLTYNGIQEQALMAGAGVHFDRNMIRVHMPALDSMFTYQTFDTTTLWHLIKRQYSRRERFTTICAHRALDDVNGAIAEARKYLRVFRAKQDVTWPD